MTRFSIARRVLLVLGATLSFAALAEFPEHPVKLVNPYPAGGTSDTIARVLAHRLSQAWGQNVIVENRSGANGSIGAAHVAGAPADGYTLLLATPAFAAYNAFNKGSGFDPLKGFAPISVVGETPAVLVVAADSPYKTAQDLVAAARTARTPFAYGTSGHGSSNHIQTESLTQLAKFAATHVPFRGDTQVTTALVGGQIQFAVLNAPGVLPLVKAGKLRALGSATAERSAAVPDTPTLIEQGLALTGASRFFVVAPAGTPQPVVERINRAVVDILSTPEVRQRFVDLGTEVKPSTPEVAAHVIRSEVGQAQLIASRF